MKDIINRLSDIENTPDKPSKASKTNKLLKEEKTSTLTEVNKSSSFKDVFENMSAMKPLPVVGQAGANNQQQQSGAGFLDINDNSPSAKAIQNAVSDLVKQNKAQIVMPTNPADAPNNMGAQGMQAVQQNQQNMQNNQMNQPLREVEGTTMTVFLPNSDEEYDVEYQFDDAGEVEILNVHKMVDGEIGDDVTDYITNYDMMEIKSQIEEKLQNVKDDRGDYEYEQSRDRQLDEISKDTLKSYKKKASKEYDDITSGEEGDVHPKHFMGPGNTMNKRAWGINTASDKLSGSAKVPANEEQLDEISKDTLSSYLDKAYKSISKAHKNYNSAHSREYDKRFGKPSYHDTPLQYRTPDQKDAELAKADDLINNPSPTMKKHDRTLAKRYKGTNKAANKLSGNAKVRATESKDLDSEIADIRKKINKNKNKVYTPNHPEKKEMDRLKRRLDKLVKQKETTTESTNYDTWRTPVIKGINKKMMAALKVMSDGRERTRTEMLHDAGIDPNPGMAGFEKTDYYLYKKGLITIVGVKGKTNQKIFKITQDGMDAISSSVNEGKKPDFIQTGKVKVSTNEGKKDIPYNDPEMKKGREIQDYLDKERANKDKKNKNPATKGSNLEEGIKEKVKGALRREFKKDVPFVQSRQDYAWTKGGEAYQKGDKKTGDRYMNWHDKQEIKESTMRSNPKISAARHEGKTHGLRGNAYHGKNYDDLEEQQAYHEGYKEGLDECYGTMNETSMPASSMSSRPMMEDSNTASQLEAIGAEIVDLVNQAMDLVRGTSEEGAARSYWYPHILGAVSKENAYSGGSMITLMDTVMALDAGDDDEYLGEYEGNFGEGVRDNLKKVGMAAALGATALGAGGMAKGAYDYHHKEVPGMGMSQSEIDKEFGLDPAAGRKSYFGTNTNEAEMDEGNAFTGRLAKAREMGADRFDLDGDGDMEEVLEFDEVFESWNKQLSELINEGTTNTKQSLTEGMTLSVNKGNGMGSDSVSVTATDQDADELLAIIKNAGLGLFGEEPVSEPSSAMSVQPQEIEPEAEIEVIDGADSMLGLMQKLSGIETVASDDYEEENEEEAMVGADWGFGTSNYSSAVPAEEANDENEEETTKVDSDEVSDDENTEDEEEKVDEGEQTCMECGGMMEAGHSCGSKEMVEEGSFFSLLNKLTKLNEGDELDSEGHYVSPETMEGFTEKVINSDDPFELIDDGLKGVFGEEVLEKLQQCQDEILQDSEGRLHPDDDYEEIVNQIIDKLNEPDEEDDISPYDEEDSTDWPLEDGEALNEWANKAGQKGTEHAFTQDIEFMTQTIAGGLNKPKSTGQTTVPVVSRQPDRQHDHENETTEDWMKLAGIKKS